MRNVLIPVTVQPMQIVKPAITEAFALADQATQEILMLKAVDQVRPHQLETLEHLFKTIPFLSIPVPEPVVEEQDCRIDVDCPAFEICYQEGGRNRCVDPCTTIAPCVANAACKVHSTTPTRTMSCTCFEGYTGNGIVRCDKISKLRMRQIG